MKNLKKILLICVAVAMMVQPLMASASEGDGPDRSKYKDLFVFKTDKKFVGANVEVLYANGQVMTSHVLQKRKVVIDFSDVKHGSYKVRVTKGSLVKEYNYEKK